VSEPPAPRGQFRGRERGEFLQPAARRSPPQPRRVVQQLPQQQAAPRDLPLDPALANLFGIRDNARATR